MHAGNVIKWPLYFYRLILPSRFQRSYLADSYQKLRVAHPNFENLRLIIGDIAKIESRKKHSKDLIIANISYGEIAIAMNQQIIHYIFSKFWYRKIVIISTGLNFPFFLPLKKEWSDCFTGRGFNVNSKICLILWRLFLLILLLRNTAKFCKSMFYNWRSKNFESNPNELTVEYFYDFPDSALQMAKDVSISNFAKWYLIKSRQEMVIICSNNIANEKVIGNTDVCGRKKAILEIRLIIILMKYLLKYLTFGNFKSLILLLTNINDVSIAIRLILYREFLPYQEVIFNASLGYARPLWSVVLNKLNIKSKLYFYANNSSPLSGDFSNAFFDGWQFNNWEYICAIDKHQASSIRRVSDGSCEVEFPTNIPMWADQDTSLNCLPEKYILVFDNNLHLYNYNFGFLAANGADTLPKIEQFLSDILEIAKNLNLSVVYKCKRPAQSFKDKEIDALLNKYEMASGKFFKILREDVSPHRLVHGALFVVGKPISTALLIANEFNIKCAYYDVTASISESDPEIRGIKTVSNRLALEKMINEL